MRRDTGASARGFGGVHRPSDLVGGHAEKTFKPPDYDGKLS
jgi:hypothetical protein